MLLKQFVRKQFEFFFFFYSYLRWRIFISFSLSFCTGLLDGLGLALFIPLLQLVFNDKNSDPSKNSNFLSEFFFDKIGLEPNLMTVFILIFVLFSVKGAIKFIDSYLKLIWQQKMMRDIRYESLSLFSNFQYSAFVDLDVGRIQNTLGGEVAKINFAFKFYFKAINFAILVMAYFTLSILVNWKFTILVLFGGLLINLISKILYKRTKYFSRKLVSETHRYHKLLIENINLFKYLKATGLINNYMLKLKSSILKMEKVQRNLGIVDAALFGIREPLIILVIFSSIFLYNQFFQQEIAGVLLSLLLIYRAFSFFMASQEQWNLFLGNSGSLENLENFKTELINKQESTGQGRVIKNMEKSLSLKNIKFRYHGDEKLILDNVSVNINKNKSIAIVGASGSGKSTLMNILSGLLVPGSGDFFIDGINFKDLNRKSYRERLGYIVQDATIFNDTVFNNVSFWDEKNEVNLKRFKEATKKAKIDQFINRLPEKEDNLLGANGVNISGGQKQRISIARELYKNVDILFLDEATSSLDTETEFEIQKNIDELKGQYTFITIAHRIATVKNADLIILLERGKVTGEGSYHELIKSSKSFKKMVELQEL